MRNAKEGREEVLGFTVNPRRSRREGPPMVTYLDFADDIALVSDTAGQAPQELLERVEKAGLRVGLHMNARKTKYTVFNQQDQVIIKTTDGSSLTLNIWGPRHRAACKISNYRKALSWKACNKVNKI